MFNISLVWHFVLVFFKRPDLLSYPCTLTIIRRNTIFSPFFVDTKESLMPSDKKTDQHYINNPKSARTSTRTQPWELLVFLFDVLCNYPFMFWYIFCLIFSSNNSKQLCNIMSDICNIRSVIVQHELRVIKILTTICYVTIF